MRYMSMLIVMTAMVFMLAGSARGDNGPRGNDHSNNYGYNNGYNHYNPPPPPPKPSKSCACDSHGNLIDKNCGKGSDSNLP
jgi:hypothetical protein